MNASDPSVDLLAIRALRKSFGATRALADVDLTLRAGQIHALVGQNGSGKSTLIKILSGYHQADGGSITVAGHSVSMPLRPGDAVRYGMAFLHQDAPVAADMTVLENLRVGRFGQRLLAPVSWARERTRVSAILRSVGLDLDPDVMAGSLPQAERALLGFAGAVQTLPDTGGILILDEPTACLPPGAAERLFSAVRATAAAGSAVLFVSHRLDEVLKLSDCISVLREGHLVAELATARTDRDEIVEKMIGGRLTAVYPGREHDTSSPALRARGVTGSIVRDVDIDIRGGEVVGVTGLIGMGQDELPYLLYGAVPMRRGSITLNGAAVTRVKPAAMRAGGVALLPADRAHASGVPAATVGENLTLPVLPRLMSNGFLRKRREQTIVGRALRQFDVRPPVATIGLAALSGGNQQKVLLAKWLQCSPQVLLLHEPTQGVDVGARSQIFRIIAQASEQGTAVMIASSEYADLAHLCDRVVVLRDGRAVAELARDTLSEQHIVRACLVAA